MSKRPNLLDTIKSDKTAEQPAEVVPISAATKPAKKNDDIVRSSVYFPKPVHEKLREIAFTQRCKVHDLVMEGLTKVLKEHGYPSVEELTKK